MSLLVGKVGELAGVVLALVVGMIITGVSVYVLSQIGQQSGIDLISTLGQTLSNWASQWYPIIMIVTACCLIIGFLISGFRGS